MEIAVFDDEEFFCKQVARLLDQFFTIYYPEVDYHVSDFSNIHQFTNYLNSNTPYITFLDIGMSENGNADVELAKKIRKNDSDCHIVFISSYAYKLGQVLNAQIRPSQFFTKPISASDITNLMKEIIESTLESKSSLTLRFGRYCYIVDINNILVVRKENRNTFVIMPDQQIEVTTSVKSISSALPDYFIFIDKGTVVNSRKIIKVDFSNRFVYLENDYKISMSRNSKKTVALALDRSANSHPILKTTAI